MTSRTKKTPKDDDILMSDADATTSAEPTPEEHAEPVEAELVPDAQHVVPASAQTWQDVVGSVEQQAEAGDDPIVQLVNEYKEAIKARDEANDKYLRAAAEFANARRRAELRADNEVRSARERVLNSMLPIVDDFERAFQAVPADAGESTWVEGFALIQRKLHSILQREGVTAIEAQGQPFDVTRHQAVMVEEAEGAPSGIVLEVLQQGYMLDDRVLRPAMVKVAQ
jgi:molecular chaperone GrpE